MRKFKFTFLLPVEKHPNVWVGKAKQSGILSVDESGEEAAAVTRLLVNFRMAQAVGPIRFYVDEPFICAMRDTTLGETLFVARIVDPTVK